MKQPIACHVAPPRRRPTADAAFDAAVRGGIEAADAGRLSPFEPVADWLASWGTEDGLTPPE